MAVDSQGVVYITDKRAGSIQKFSISGELIGQFSSPGEGNGKLRSPVGIAIDSKDYVHISEPSLQRVSIFTSAGRFSHYFQVCPEDQDSATEDNSNFRVATLAFDKYDNLYACIPKKGQVVIL